MATSPESSGTEPSVSKDPPRKKRRTPGACDHCKQKKIRCDSAQMPGNRCSNCIQSSLECTHREVSKTLGSAKGYVESLEIRLAKMEKLLTKLLPETDLNGELEIIDDASTPPESSLLPRNDDDIHEEELIGRLKRLHVKPQEGRFFGKSSGYQMLQTALDIRREYTGHNQKALNSIGASRTELWYIPSWHSSRREASKPPSYVFPDDDLLPSLVDAYFTRINLFFPLLHRPTFEKSVADGLHRQDWKFGGTVLLVCALGSRYSEDPRVFYPGTTASHSVGWRWFEQVSVLRTSFVEEPSLNELQNHALSVLFAQTSETPQGCWTQLGTALRMAQEVGAHRKRTLEAPTADDELWKRVFWVLMALDRFTSAMSGRQCAIQEEDFDVDRPVECDDEYWDPPDPSLAFQQPANKPSTITYFNCYLNLTDILARAMRVIYSVKESTLPSGKRAPYLDQKKVMALDSAMNGWMDSVPDHLRWNPSSKDKLFLKQSGALYASYYHLQIFIHRPFIPSPRNPSPTTFPSLAICTNAARSCCHVIEIQSESEITLPMLHPIIFAAAIVLLLNIWSGKKSGFAPHPQREIDDVRRCLNLLKASERRWCSAGRYRMILMELATAGDLPVSDGSTDSIIGTKRHRDSDTSPESNAVCQSTGPAKQLRILAGTRRIPNDTPMKQAPEVSSSQALNYELPMYGTELGRLPIFGEVNFSESFQRPRSVPFAVTDNGNDPAAAASYNSRDAQSPQANGFASCEWDLFSAPQGPNPTPPEVPFFYPGQFAECGADGAPFMDNDTLDMWSTAPSGFELNEWGTYISNVDRMTQASGTFGNTWVESLSQ